MRAEDLFEAMEGIDENLIARSEKKVKTSREVEAHKRGRRKRIYRFAVIAMTTAAAVFILLLTKDFLSGGRADTLGATRQAMQEPQTRSAEEKLMVEEPDLYLDESEEAEAEAAESDTDSAENADADQGSATGSNEAEEAEEEITEESADTETASKKAEETVDNTDSVTAEGSGSATESTEDAAEGSGKTAVDLLGDLKGDYIKLEYISAADEAAGGSRKEPEYSEEGEAALSAAFNKGKAKPSILANTGKAEYYVYLTKKSGEVDKATFYVNEYISIDSIPGVVMKLAHEDYEKAMELFR